MGRHPKEWSDLPPLRQFWQDANRRDRAAQAALRAERKARDQKRRKCRCAAYKFPHRPGGGVCRYPDAPAVRWQDVQSAEIAERVAKFKTHYGEPNAAQLADLAAMTTKPTRPYRNRYAGIRRQIARNNGLHPISDRALIDSLLPRAVAQAKQIKGQNARVKYRNIEIAEAEGSGAVVRGVFTSAGPTM